MPLDLVLVLLLIAGGALLYFMMRKKPDSDLEKPRKAKNLDGAKKSAEPLRLARRYAALHQYQVIAPAQLAKDGKYADLDFILVGWFGLLCVKCVGLGGQIYGSLEDEMWLQLDGEKRVSFANPMRAAEADTRLVRDTLFSAKLRNISVETVCVFTNKSATLLLPRGTGHYTVKEFKALLGKSKYEQDKGVDIPAAVAAVTQWLAAD